MRWRVTVRLIALRSGDLPLILTWEFQKEDEFNLDWEQDGRVLFLTIAGQACHSWPAHRVLSAVVEVIAPTEEPGPPQQPQPIEGDSR